MAAGSESLLRGLKSEQDSLSIQTVPSLHSHEVLVIGLQGLQHACGSHFVRLLITLKGVP